MNSKADLSLDDYRRLPRLYRTWDFTMLLEEGYIYRIEGAGRTDDGQPLFAVYTSRADQDASDEVPA